MMNQLLLIFVGIGIGLAVVKLIYTWIPKLEKRALDKSKSEAEREYCNCKSKIEKTGLRFSEFQGKFHISISTIEGLTEARQKLRNVFGKWNDKKEMIWNTGNNALCDWITKDYPIIIRLSCSVEDFPEELQGERCKFKKEVTESWNYVCE